MSYRQDEQYSRPPPVPPRPPYHDPQQQQQQQYEQYAQQQNGAYPPQPLVPQYPGQPIYNHYLSGGPVQQPQPEYSSPQSASAPSYGGQQYPSAHSYNPQQYSPRPLQAQIPQYNPQAYANPQPLPYPSNFHPAAYPAEPPAQATSGPLGDPYAFSSNRFSGTTFGQSSQAQAPSLAHLSLQTPGSGSQYGQLSETSPAPPAHGYSYQPPALQSSLPQDVPYQNSLYHRQPYNYTSISPALPGLTDDASMPSPPNYHVNDNALSPSPLQQTISRGSLPSPLASTPAPTPPAHGPTPLWADSSDRHPQSRPLPGPPGPSPDAEHFFDGDESQMSREEEEARTQEELFTEVENAVLNAGRETWSPSTSVTSTPLRQLRHAPSVYTPSSPRNNGGLVNGHRSPVTGSRDSGDQLSDDSDAEAAAGLMAMRMDDERQAAEDARRRSDSTARFSGLDPQRQAHPLSHTTHGSDSDEYRGVDMTMYGGGHDVPISYGGDPNQLSVGGELNGEAYSQPISSQNSSTRRSHASQSSRGEHVYTPGSAQSFAPFNAAARVDAGGTGGNYEPPPDGRRHSFDEGDEYTFMEGQLPERFPDEPPDIFYHPAAATYRPLPPPPPPPRLPIPDEGLTPLLVTDMKGQQPYAPDEYSIDSQGRWVPRSASLVSHSITPQVPQPLRSKTDAEERKQRLYRTSGYSSTFESTPASASAVALDLPSLAAKRFVPSKLGALDFKKCEEPWALSALVQWLVTVTTPDQITELKESAVKEALVNLFTNKVPTMNIADAEGLSTRVVQDMYLAGAMQQTEEWVKLVPAPMSGVIFQLTGAGCYAPTLHDHIIPGRCYAHHCQRTLKKVNLLTHPTRSSEAWADFYKLKKEDLEGKDRKEIERQHVLHEIVQTEEIFMEQLNVLRAVYRDPLIHSDPQIIAPKRMQVFIKDVFGRVDAVKQANEDHLLPQLKYRQQEQGPWVVGFSDIFRQWIRKAKSAYIDYAGAFPSATFLVRQEVERNIQFASFLDRARVDTRSLKLGWDTYLKAPITRLQRYTLLLQTVLKTMKADSEEKANLEVAYDEVKSVTMECDTRVAEMQRKVDLADLGTKLVLRPGMRNAVELNLNHLGRELVHRGDLQRMGNNRFSTLDSHALLFDHYLVLAKTETQRAEQGGKMDKYDVSRLPIPMDLLVLENANEPPVQKSSYVKGISTVSAVSARTPTPNDPTALSKSSSSQSMPSLQTANTGASQATLHTVSSLESGKDYDRILYPFRVKHLGRETYSLFAYTEQSRREWCNKIIEAKTKHAAALFAQHAEPFRLRVMADSAFVYDGFASSGSKTSVLIAGTPVDRAIKEVAYRFKDTGRPGPICRARVNCATSFTTPDPAKRMVAVGTDYGVYVSEVDNPRGWSKVRDKLRARVSRSR